MDSAREHTEKIIKQIGEWFIDNAGNITDDFDKNSIRSIKAETNIESGSLTTIKAFKEYCPIKIERN